VARPRVAPLLSDSVSSTVCIAKEITKCYWSEESLLSLPLGFTIDTRIIGKERRAQVRLTVQCLNNRSHEQNLMSTPGQTEPIAQHFLKNFTTEALNKETRSDSQLVYSCLE
jgi:hypothetical protein